MRIRLLFGFLIAFSAIGLTLFLFWRGGVIGQEEEFAPAIMRELQRDGVSARFIVDPEVGVRPGDLLSISLLVAFDSNRAEVDQGQILENYIEFKERVLETCEEYAPPEVHEGNRRGFLWFSFEAVFQCWVVDEGILYLPIEVSYVGKDGSYGLIRLAKYITFITIPIGSEYRPMIESVVVHRGPGAWFLAGGILLLVSGFLVLADMWFRGRKKKSAGFMTELPQDYFLESIKQLFELVEILEPQIVVDKLYHLCLQYESERDVGEQDTTARQLASLREELQRWYGIESIDKSEIERHLFAFKKIAEKGGVQT